MCTAYTKNKEITLTTQQLQSCSKSILENLVSFFLQILSDSNDPFWRSEYVEEFSDQYLLELQVTPLPHCEYVMAESYQWVWVKNFIHCQSIGKVCHVRPNESTNHQNHWHIQGDDSTCHEENEKNFELQ